MLYLYVSDINEYESVSRSASFPVPVSTCLLTVVVFQKIVKAGGKKMTDIMPEGDRAVMQHFEDTEGNYLGIYSMKK